MSAYAALLSLARSTHPNRTQDKSLISYDSEETVTSIHDYVNNLLFFFEKFPEKVNRWEGRIRAVAHKIEDIIEIFVWHRIQSGNRVMMNSSRGKLEDQLANVKQEIGLIAGEVMEERPAPSLSPSSSASSRLASTGDDTVIGLHDDIMAIKERLCGMSPNLQVIPIVGMGGIGKTTLARSVYDDKLIIHRFDVRAWVVVSQDYYPHRFRKSLLDSMKLLGKKLSTNEMDAAEIDLKLYQYLKYRRYLVVIDDVWGTKFWDDVSRIFPDDTNGSRILLTTRQLNVAACPYTVGSLHEMQLLNDSQSWDLLNKRVFANGCCPPYLEDIGKQIAQRCAGLPLAVVLVAGVLSSVSKTSVYWEEVAKNVNNVVGQDSELEEILSLSYNYLPHHLRPCFLFIGGFLDVTIRASRLIRLWVAEDFLKGCSKSLEEEAEEYLEDLINRNLVMVTSRKSDGKIKSCGLHDMVRGLCIKKADQEKFLHVMDGNERRINLSRTDIDKMWGPNFRTILYFRFQNFPKWADLLRSYKLLKVLDVLSVDMKVLHPEVFELYHLRYIALMGSISIPSAVSNLVNLQTLVIHLPSANLYANAADVRSLPLEIWRMPQLRYLLFNNTPYMLPHPSKELNLPLQNLHTLLLVNNLAWNEKILQMIPNVKRLGLSYTCNQGYHLHHLKDLHQLEKLEVIGCLGFSWRENNPSFPCRLKKLTLVGGGFPWKNMAVVGSLPNLEILKLLNDSCSGETWEITEKDFPCLKFLLINESNLQHWITQENPLPTLQSLVLHSCRFLAEIPKGIGDIATLEMIEVDCCTKSLLESAKKIKEDQESYGNYDLQVRVGHEYIQKDHQRIEEHSSDSNRTEKRKRKSRRKAHVGKSLKDVAEEQVERKSGSDTRHVVIAEKEAEKVIIKVEYEKDIVKFEFCLSLGVSELFEQVATRLNLNLGTFKLKYMDEDNDQILLTRSADLQLCPKNQTATGRTCIRFFVQLISK